MDGQSVTQEETLAMFTKFTAFMDYIRNQLVNNTELAKRVELLQDQISELTSEVHKITGQNTALQEAVNVLTQERDQVRVRCSELIQENQDLKDKFTTRDNDANHWYAELQRVSRELEKVKGDLSALENDHLRLIDEHEKAVDKLKHIQSVFAASQAMETPNHAVPIVEEIHKPLGPQPRDPVTQQWRGWNEEKQEWQDDKGNKVA